MRRPGGYSVLTEPGKSAIEADTFTCCHCCAIVEVVPKMNPDDLGGICMLCMKPICKQCVGKECVPFEKKLEAWESRDRMLKSILG